MQRILQPLKLFGGGLSLAIMSFLIILPSVFAADLPTLTLDNGANRIALTLCNRSDID